MPHLVGPRSIRGLNFIASMNRAGLNPTTQEVRSYLSAASTVYEQYDTDRESSLVNVSTVQYLRDARLITASGDGWILSRTGRAVLETETGGATPASEPVEVVGRMTDPAFYSRLLTRIDDVQQALIIDPYLHPDDLMTLLEIPSVQRVLTKRARMTPPRPMDIDDRTRKLGFAIGSRSDVELRLAAPGTNELHDRLVLPREAGAGVLIGTSLGGTQMTVVTHLSVEATSALRAHFEAIWDSGEQVMPVARPVEET